MAISQIPIQPRDRLWRTDRIPVLSERRLHDWVTVICAADHEFTQTSRAQGVWAKARQTREGVGMQIDGVQRSGDADMTDLKGPCRVSRVRHVAHEGVH